MRPCVNTWHQSDTLETLVILNLKTRDGTVPTKLANTIVDWLT